MKKVVDCAKSRERRYQMLQIMSPDARPFLAAHQLLTAENQKQINIYLDRCHAERWCL